MDDVKPVTEQERETATQLFVNEIQSLQTKIDVLTEPYLEAKSRMNSFSNRIILILNDYVKLRQENMLLKAENAGLKKKLEKHEPEKTEEQKNVKNVKGGENQ